jgi:hypothetical protein
MATRWGGTRFELAVEWYVLKHRPREWFLLSGSRLAVTGFGLLVVSATVWTVVTTGVVPLERETPVLFLLFALISGNFTLITIVISISQFVLARHLESPGEIREKTDEMVQYRREVGATTGQRVVPVAPSEFILLLFRTIARRVEALSAELDTGSGAESAVDDAVRADLDALVTGLAEHAEYVMALLGRPSAGLNYALFATLNASYEQDIYDAWRLRTEHADALPADTVEALDVLVESLEQVDVARRVFKTSFIQSELAALSRTLLYIGVPVQVVTVVLMLLFTGSNSWTTAPATLRLIIPTIVTAGFAPILLLTAYILRLATVARRTASMYPFTNQVGR